MNLDWIGSPVKPNLWIGLVGKVFGSGMKKLIFIVDHINSWQPVTKYQLRKEGTTLCFSPPMACHVVTMIRTGLQRFCYV